MLGVNGLELVQRDRWECWYPPILSPSFPLVGLVTYSISNNES